ncbi:MAG: YihY/virulence factor BrkB family protein [Armatimonadetes bacterium]|nr:YihY/virulence factor BrkB family protein [Armatimonadota bacterium]
MPHQTIRDVYLPAAREWSKHSGARLAAALSFYSILSLAPLLVVAVTIATQIIDTSTVRQTLYDESMQSLGKGSADLFIGLVERATQPATSVFATIAAILVSVYAASGLFNQLVESVEYIWEIRREGSPVRVFLLNRLKSIVLLLGFLLVFVTWIAVDAVLGWLARTSGDFYGWPVISLLASVVFVTLVLALTYRATPRKRVRWRDVWHGAIVTGLGFSLMKAALGLYFSYSGVATAYGSAGALVIILLWTYYSAQIFFYGFEVTRVVILRRESQEVKSTPDSSEGLPDGSTIVKQESPQSRLD